MNPQEFQTDDKGNPPGIVLNKQDKLEERLTIIYPNGVDPNYVIARWENKNSVWQLNHVYTFSQVTALAFNLAFEAHASKSSAKKEIIEPKTEPSSTT